MKKTSQKILFLTFLSTFILFFLFITGCTSQKDALKEQVETSLMKESNLSDIAFSGSAKLHLQLPSNESNPFYTIIQTFSENGQLSWDGNIVDDSIEINTLFESNQTSLNVPIIITNDKLFFNIPVINPEDEYFEAEKNELLANADLNFESLYTQFLLELISKTDAQKFQDKTTETNEELQEQKIIEIEISQQDLVLVVKDFLLNEMKEIIPDDLRSNMDRSLNSYLTTENTETAEAQSNLITFVMNANGEITDQDLKLSLMDQALTIHHQIISNQNSNSLVKTPEQTLSLFDFFTYLEELGSLPEFTFEPGIFIPVTQYSDQSTEQEILNLINKNLESMIEKNKDQFFSTFSSEKNAEVGWELIQNNLYRFLQVEDLQFKNKSGKSFNVGVLYESVDEANPDQKPFMSGFTFTISKVESEWKIQKIK
ncbi:hypothetical protein [Chengkuizengella sediminis]|uniref:hypothetical protein n=1 Tax=Chengkuizengella sediminis TaxID=1885917 RepID=UPI001389FEBC|nr:hypothetical protein [Chengkuizengella sediminis]NDI33684.1 hypothetical protein [Chengkuizengella sediminis]